MKTHHILRLLPVLLACAGIGCGTAPPRADAPRHAAAVAPRRTFAASAPATGAVLVSARISPSGNLLLLRFGSNVASVARGATLTVNGGSPITLANPMWGSESLCDWVWYPLSPTLAFGPLDDGDAAICTLKGAGWAETTSANSQLSDSYHVALGEKFHQTENPADTATYTIAPPVGPYLVSVNLWGLVGPDRTADATYTVSDGRGVLATFHVNQTANQPFDSLGLGYGLRLTDLGVVTIRDGTLTVTVANAAGSGVLVADALYVRTKAPRAVPLGATVAVSAPAATFTTAAGAVPAISAVPATLTTTPDWPSPEFAFDPAAPRTMAVGYNKALPEWGQAAPLYRNLFKQSSGWMLRSGAMTLDAHGELATLSGQAGVLLASGASDADTRWGIKTIPSSGTLTIRCAYSGPGNPPLTFADETGSGSINYGAVNWRANDPSSGKRVATVTYQMRTFRPLTEVASPYYPQYTYTIGMRTTAVITGVEVYEGTPPGPSDPMTHPVTLDRLKDRGFSHVRLLDLSPHVNSSSRARYSHITEPADVSPYWAAYSKAPIAGAAITRIEPVDVTAADADDALKWFPVSANTGVCKVTTATPHGLCLLQTTTIKNSAGPVAEFASTDAGKLAFDDSNKSMAVPLTATTYLQEMSYVPGNHDAGRGMTTLAASHALTGYSVGVELSPTVAFEDALDSVRECGPRPWVNVPPLFDDASVTRMAEVLRDRTTPGGIVPVEYMNEPWNLGFRGWIQLSRMAQRQNYLHTLDPVANPHDPVGHMEMYALRSTQVFALFKAVFDAAGRGGELRHVLGVQAGWADGPGHSACNYIHRHKLRPPDWLAIDGYQDIGPPATNAFGPDLAACDAAFARLDDEAMVDVLEVSTLLGGRPGMFAAHRAMLDGTNTSVTPNVPFGAYFAGTRIVNYEEGLAFLSTQNFGHAYVGAPVQRSHAIARHPRIFPLELKRFKQLQDSGCAAAMGYTLDKTDVLNGAANWIDYPGIDIQAGHGFATENANPYDLEKLVSQTGGARRFWASSATSLPTPAPAPTPTPTPTNPTPTTLTTRLRDTFTGTPGAPLDGTVPTPTPHGSDTWRRHEAGTFAGFVFAAGGGATTAGTGPWYEVHPLTGIGLDQTVTVAFRFVTVGAASLDLYARRDPDDGFAVVRAATKTGQLRLGDQGAEGLAAAPVAWVAGRTYRLKIALTGTAATVSLDGAAKLTATVGAAGGSQLVLSQSGGAAGAVVVEEVLVETAGTPTPTPTPTPAPASTLTKADLEAAVGAAWEAARPRLAVPVSPVPAGKSTWICPALTLYGDDGKGKWRVLGTAVSTYGPDGKGGWVRVRTTLVPYGPDGQPLAPAP